MKPKQKRTIVGKWNVVGGKVVADQNCTVIDHLVTYHLVEMASREGGWTTLHRDPVDGILWERTYPESGLHGGGPPTLTEISAEEARQRYGAALDDVSSGT